MMTEKCAPWAHCGLAIGLLAGTYLGIRLMIETGTAAYLNTAAVGALAGYLVGLVCCRLAEEMLGLTLSHKKGETYG